MKVMVIGAGLVGSYISEYLSAENHDVTLIEKNPDICRKASDALDAMVIEGDGASPDFLMNAGLKACDMLIAVSPNDEVNIIACLAAAKAGVNMKIARLRNAEFSNVNSLLTKDDLGIDLIIHPEQETARELVWLVKRSAATDVIEFEDGRVQLVGVRVDITAPIINKTLQQIDTENPDVRFRAVAIFRGNKTFIPSGQDYVNRGDQLFFITKTELVPRLLTILGKNEEKMENIMILGGGRVGRLVAAEVEKDKDVTIKLVESNREKSAKIAQALQRTLIIVGDGTDLDLLAVEGIMDMDSYIAVTNDEETNIISCLMAKHLGVRRCLALVNRPDYLPIMGSIGVDAAVDTQTITANAILRFIRRGNIISLASLPGIDAEVIQIDISKKSRVAGKKMKSLNLAHSGMVGIISRNGDVMIPAGEDVLLPGDKIIVFTTPSSLPRVEKIFVNK
ncbi:Trk system potassium transporter TrkA [candidate division KSB1 bacterium]|nr:Trk system potassium transporter TrkA [candidate division KSB1 bacterium]